MKIIIVEGLDNIGKSTIIEFLRWKLEIEKHLNPNRIYTVHFTMPRDMKPEEQIVYIDNFNNTICNELEKMQRDNLYDIAILDRSWYSEYVYGLIYRNREPKDILHNIKLIELSLMWYFELEDIHFLYLQPKNIDFVISHEDGLSLSAAKKTIKARKQLIEQEKMLFDEMFNKSLLPSDSKHQLIVTTDNEYENTDKIVKEILRITYGN